MFHFYKTASGEILASDHAVFPQSLEIHWKTLFPIDERREYLKVAPVFPDAASAVRWLRNTMAYSQQLPSYSRVSLPDFTTVPFDQIHESGMGVMNNYGELVRHDGAPTPTFLFRGQRDNSEALLPTLARPLWLPVGLGKGTLKEAIRVNEAEQKCTSFFVNKFFKEFSKKPGFEWLAELSVQRRAAIARHHGFYSWIMDYTLDPGIAAFFASSGGSTAPPREGIGGIYIVDEHDLSQMLQCKPAIVNHVGYQERSWTKIKMETILPNCAVNFGGKAVGTLILPSFWEQLRQHGRALEQFCLRLSFAPGMEAHRMWNQKWCGVEAICDDETWTRIVTAYQFFARIIGCVFFRQTGSVYCEPEANITMDGLLPRNDHLENAIVEFKNHHGLKPGEAIYKFLKENP
jgi:hypothetical protein